MFLKSGLELSFGLSYVGRFAIFTKYFIYYVAFRQWLINIFMCFNEPRQLI